MYTNRLPSSPASSPANDTRVEELLAQMTLAEKIGQMTQVEKNSISPEEVTQYSIGSLLSGGGGNPTPNTPQSWAEMVRTHEEAALRSRLGIPLVYGVDAVHGHNNVKGAVIFPHNIGLGATRNAELVEKIGQITAIELLATNVHWTFAPALSVPQDIRWGRTYEGFSEQTDLVTELAVAAQRGLQSVQDNGRWVLATPKHFVADGGTQWGSRKVLPWQSANNWQAALPHWKIDQGDAILDEQTLRSVHLRPYEAAIAEGAQCIMVSFSSWNGEKLHKSHYLLTDVLKGELGFQGFLVSDWAGIDQIDADYYICTVQSINAGLDMIMVPYDFKRFITALTEAVQKGDVSEARIDDAVRRILRVKLALGLFESPFGDEAWMPRIGADEHRSVAREAVRQSLVLLKNEGNVLPLKKDMQHLLVAGHGAHDIGLQCGGWSIEWQGQSGNITPGTTILQGIQQIVGEKIEITYSEKGEFIPNIAAEVGLVVVGEAPYAEGNGDNGDLRLSAEDIALIERMRDLCQKLVVVLISGRPLIIGDQLPLMDALVAAWLPGTEGNGVADVLFGDYPFTGKLSFHFPRQNPSSAADADEQDTTPLFAWGFGL